MQLPDKHKTQVWKGTFYNPGDPIPDDLARALGYQLEKPKAKAQAANAGEKKDDSSTEEEKDSSSTEEEKDSSSTARRTTKKTEDSK